MQVHVFGRSLLGCTSVQVFFNRLAGDTIRGRSLIHVLSSIFVKYDSYVGIWASGVPFHDPVAVFGD
jgi:hypothetical protein